MNAASSTAETANPAGSARWPTVVGRLDDGEDQQGHGRGRQHQPAMSTGAASWFFDAGTLTATSMAAAAAPGPWR